MAPTRGRRSDGSTPSSSRRPASLGWLSSSRCSPASADRGSRWWRGSPASSATRGPGRQGDGTSAQYPVTSTYRTGGYELLLLARDHTSRVGHRHSDVVEDDPSCRGTGHQNRLAVLELQHEPERRARDHGS